MWSDWGTASRIMGVLAKIGKVPRPDGSRRTTARKTANGYPFVGKVPFDGDFRIREVAVQK
jgi:hypothetical protein